MAFHINSTATPRELFSQRPGTLTSNQANRDHQLSDIVFLPEFGPDQDRTAAVVALIREILGAVQEDLFNDRVLSIPYRSRRSAQRPDDARPDSVLRFPGRTLQEANKFARMVRILGLSHGALIAGTILTKRNIFYQDIELFGSQAVVDQLVDDLACTLRLGRDDLNIVAAGKGLISGPITINLRTDVQIDASSGTSGVLVPFVKDILSIDFASSRWALLVEKEATFRSLTATRYWDKSGAGRGILVTGKGYPDLVTRSFLHALQAMKPEMPIYALVDFDPDGLRILRCYKHGSRSLSHEAGIDLPQLQWLGIRSIDLRTDGQQSRDVTGEAVENAVQETPASTDKSTTILLSNRDRRCGQNLLASVDEDSEDVDEAEYRRELQIMLYLGVKAEIQAVDDMGDVTDWLDTRLVWAAGEGL